jgi:hypothetical protein
MPAAGLLVGGTLDDAFGVLHQALHDVLSHILIRFSLKVTLDAADDLLREAIAAACDCATREAPIGP